MKKQKNSGFTVIELLITIALIAILAVMTVKITKTATVRSNFTATLNQFVADYSFARQLASRTNRYVAIVFDKSGTFYNIMTQDKTGNFEDFTSVKRVEPVMGKDFYDYDATPSFTVNSMGMIREYPINANSPLKSITIELYQKKMDAGSFLFKRKIQIYSTGGVKVQRNTFNYDDQ